MKFANQDGISESETSVVRELEVVWFKGKYDLISFELLSFFGIHLQASIILPTTAGPTAELPLSVMAYSA